MWIKICGITSVHDAQLAVEAGADYVGLIFVPESPRCIAFAQAREIVDAVKGKVRCVGVFQNPEMAHIQACLDQIPLDLVQLHGTESPAFCQAMPVPVIKALTYDPKTNTTSLAEYAALSSTSLHALLVDGPKGDAEFQWERTPLAGPLKPAPNFPPVFLAGRLTPETVAPLIQRFQPDGVDVASGVETSPGMKDLAKLQAFCQAVRHVAPKPGGVAPCNP